MMHRKIATDKCNCTADGDVGKGNFSLALQLLHMCGHRNV